MSSAALLVASILIGLISFFTIRGINHSLAAMRNAVSRIEGDLDFTVQAEVIGNDEISDVSTAINRLLNKLRANLSSIANGSRSVASAANLMSTTSAEVATASQQQSESASDMAATVEELTVSINHVGDRAQEANRDVYKRQEQGKAIPYGNCGPTQDSRFVSEVHHRAI